MTKLRLPILIIACSLMAASMISATITCPGLQILDEATQTCLISRGKCTKNVSSDGTKCTASCAQGEKVYTYQIDEETRFQQCYTCEDKTLFYLNTFNFSYQCVSECQAYQITDMESMVCAPCNKKIFTNPPECKDTCDRNQMIQEELVNIDGQKAYKCVDSCDYGFIPSVDKKHCIQNQECIYFIEGESCVSNCSPGMKQAEQIDGTPYILCIPSCPQYEYVDDNDNVQCVSKCPTDYALNENNQCIYIESCTGTITSDKTICFDGMNCNQNEYPKKIKDNQFQCSYCGKKFDTSTKECLDQCPQGKIANSYGVCVSILKCKLFSADNSTCMTNDCIYPELKLGNKCINPCLGKDNCQPTCPKGYYLKPNQSGYECSNICDSYITSDKKYCVNFCSNAFEAEPTGQISKICHACQDNEYTTYDGNKRKASCISQFSLTLENVLSLYQQKFDSIFMYPQVLTLKDDVNKSFGWILNMIKNNKNSAQGINIILQLQLLILQYAQNTQPLVFDQSNEIKSLGFKIRSEKQKNFFVIKKDFDASDFQSNSNYELTTYKQDYNYVNDYFGTVSAILLNNPFCTNCSYSKLFQISQINLQNNNKLRLLQQQTDPTYTVKFVIDASITNVAQLVCVTYDSFGQMTGLVSSTKLSDDKKSITCSFSNNAALYLDTTCLFTDKTKCTNSGNNSNEEQTTNSNILNSSILALLMLILLFNF